VLLHRVRGFVWGVHADAREEPPPAHDLTIGELAELDIDRVEAFLDELASLYLVREVAFDPWGFMQAAQHLSNRGLTMVEFPQTNDRMCPASDALAQVINKRRLVHNGDEVLKAHVEAAVAKDVGRSWRLTKDPKLAVNPNDFAIATALAVYRAEMEYAAGMPSVTVIAAAPAAA
jgi:phage terminase large subunit-like protein